MLAHTDQAERKRTRGKERQGPSRREPQKGPGEAKENPQVPPGRRKLAAQRGQAEDLKSYSKQGTGAGRGRTHI